MNTLDEKVKVDFVIQNEMTLLLTRLFLYETKYFLFDF